MNTQTLRDPLPRRSVGERSEAGPDSKRGTTRMLSEGKGFMLQRRPFLVLMVGLLLGTARLPARAEEVPAPGGAAQRVHFEADVVPILRAYCWKCHGGEGRAG